MTKHLKTARRWKKDADTIDRATEEPTRQMRGVDELVDAVRAEALEEFPMDRSGIDYSFGDIELKIGREVVPIRELTEHLARERFDSPDDLLLGLREALANWKGVSIPLDELHRPEREQDVA